MRVIAGSAKGRKLVAPKTADVRPAMDRFKEALFSILYDVSDLKVLDLFAGSGSVGIEALSRGADSATFVDSSALAIASIKTNLDACKFSQQAKVVRSNVADFLDRTSPQAWDLVFIDPPYALTTSDLDHVALGLGKKGMLSTGARLVFERARNDEAPPLPEGYEITLQRNYGQTSLFIGGVKQ